MTRRVQFRLRTLFVVFVIAAVILAMHALMAPSVRLIIDVAVIALCIWLVRRNRCIQS
jgi:hypothetical protein